MTVWIVMYSYYDESSIEGVFSTVELAEAWINSFKNKHYRECLYVSEQKVQTS